MNYNFDEIIPRENTSSVKFDLRKEIFGVADVIPMWVADMDFKTPDFVIDAIRKRTEHEIMGYTFRSESFYHSIIRWMKKRHGWEIQQNWIAFSPGVVPALNLAVMAFTNPGDKIIVQRPVYFPFFPAIESHGRILVNNPLIYSHGKYVIDFEDLERKADNGVKMMLLCSPHNPTGNVWSREDLEKISGICRERKIIILSDEIHSDLIYKDHTHFPTAMVSPEVSDLTVTCVAPSKTFNLAGLSTSVVIASNSRLKNLYDKMLEEIHVGGGNIFGYTALESAYNHGEEWLAQLMNYLLGNLDFLIEFLKKEIPRIKPVIPQATYMVWLDCTQLGMDEKELKRFMISEAGLGLSDGILFGPEGKGFQRINIGCPRKTLSDALIRLKTAVVHRFNL